MEDKLTKVKFRMICCYVSSVLRAFRSESHVITIGWLIIVRVVLIYLSIIRVKLKGCFGLDIDDFLQHLIEAF